MGWNYRIIRHHDCLMLHEVHYHDDGRVRSYTADPATFVADLDEGAGGISGGLKLALTAALADPILDVADLPGGGSEVDPHDPMVRHEAMDRASLFAGVVDSELVDHPGIAGDPVLKAAAERAQCALAELYRLAGEPPAG